MLFRQYRQIRSDESFLVFADLATGLGDYCAVQFLSRENLDIPLVYHSKLLATEMTNDIYPVLNRLFDITDKRPMVAYERNNGGVFEMDRLAALNRSGKFEIFQMPTYGQLENEQTKKLGYDTNSATRPKMLADWKEAVDKKLVTIYDRATINEHFSFVIVNTTSSVRAQAERNAHDDLVMSCAGVWQLYQLCPPAENNSDYDNDRIAKSNSLNFMVE
jgi:hypothetical protein